jgi:DNA-binding NarL/FixJ family response regulator
MRLRPSTVKRHVENILRKLHLKNRIEAAVYAVTKATWASEKLGAPK